MELDQIVATWVQNEAKKQLTSTLRTLLSYATLWISSYWEGRGGMGSQCSDYLLGTLRMPQVFTVSRWREDGLCVVAFVAGPVLLPALSRLEHIFQESMMI